MPLEMPEIMMHWLMLSEKIGWKLCSTLRASEVLPSSASIAVTMLTGFSGKVSSRLSATSKRGLLTSALGSTAQGITIR